MIRKAIITAAGKGTRQYPATNAVQKEMFPLVDRDGLAKPTIQIIVEEALSAGIEEIAIIVQPGEEKQFVTHFQGLSEHEAASFRDKPWGVQQSELLRRMQQAIVYVHQTEQKGFGHAVYCAREFADGEPTLLLLGDHVYVSHSKTSCAQQLLAAYARRKKSIFSVQQTPIEQLFLFGTVAGEGVDDSPGLYHLREIAEKPSPDYARRHLQTAGLAEDMFLTIFGMYLLTPTIFDILGENINQDRRENGEIQLTTALAELVRREGALALQMAGTRLDMGTPLGYLQTLLALALRGPHAEALSAFLRNGAK